jgi:hypothetical protein
LQTGAVAFVYVGAFGVLWVGKFMIFNKVLFAHHHPSEALPAAAVADGLLAGSENPARAAI